jgi:hypothetical protein
MSTNGSEQDRIDFPKIIAVGVVSLVIFAVATLWSISILHRDRDKLKAERGEARVATEAGKSEIGIVDQVPFQGDRRLEIWKKERKEWLHGYGWVDRQHGIIHVPIERAMEEALAGSAPPPPMPAPGSPR